MNPLDEPFKSFQGYVVSVNGNEATVRIRAFDNPYQVINGSFYAGWLELKGIGQGDRFIYQNGEITKIS